MECIVSGQVFLPLKKIGIKLQYLKRKTFLHYLWNLSKCLPNNNLTQESFGVTIWRS